MKAFAGNKVNASQKRNVVLRTIENIEGKAKNAVYHQHFLLLPHCLQKAAFSELFKVGIAW